MREPALIQTCSSAFILHRTSRFPSEVTVIPPMSPTPLVTSCAIAFNTPQRGCPPCFLRA